jgi:hypothetical protein
MNIIFIFYFFRAALISDPVILLSYDVIEMTDFYKLKMEYLSLKAIASMIG